MLGGTWTRVAPTLALLAGGAFPQGSDPGPAIQQLVEATFAPLLQPAADAAAIPGAVIGVLQGEQRHVVLFGRLQTMQADPDGPPPAAGRLLFPVASLTKPVTALLLARLATRGDLALDGPAVDCELHPNLCPDGRPITWRQLATHTSGLPLLPGNIGDGLTPDAVYGSAQLRAWLPEARLEHAPGGAFLYSTAGYAVLGLRLGDLRGAPFTRLVLDEVLAPLGLHDARFALDEQAAGLCVIGHRRDGTPAAPPPAAADGPDSALAPSGGLIVSANDLLTLLQAHLQPEPDWCEPIELLLAPHADIPSWPPSVTALGWQLLVPAGFHWHAGHGNGHHAFMAFHREGRVGVVALASAAASPSDTRLAQASFALLGGLLALPPATAPPAAR